MPRKGTILVVDDNVELASLLKAGIEARGRNAVVAQSGAEAKAAIAQEKPLAAVVDLLLPDIMGSELLDLLAAAGVPAIAITGVFKGARYAREMQDKHGARAFLEKPFAAAALFTALDGIIGAGGWEDITEEDLPPGEIIELVEDDDAAPATKINLAAEEPPRRRTPATNPDEVAHRSSLLAAEIDIALDEAPPSPQDVVTRPSPAEPPAAPDDDGGKTPHVPIEPVRAAAPSPALDLTGPLPVTDPDLPTKTRPLRAPVHAGDLAGTSVPRLLVAFSQDQETGELVLRRGKVVKSILLRHGRPVSATSNLSSERFGAFAVEKGFVDSAKAAPILAEARAAGDRSADALTKAGLLDERARRKITEALARQIITSSFAWENGAFEFRLRSHLPAGLVPLSLSLPELVLQGARALPLMRLRALVPAETNLAPAPDPQVQLHEVPLDAKEAMLVAYADGTKSVKDLLALSDMDERPALGLLYALRALGLVTETERVLASTKRMGFL